MTAKCGLRRNKVNRNIVSSHWCMFSRSLLLKVINRYRNREIARNSVLSSTNRATEKFGSADQMNNKMKYILVTGGVISGVGKGVIASSFGTLLNCCGISVTSLKIDPYINIDAGTFSPYEHGKLLIKTKNSTDNGQFKRTLGIYLVKLGRLCPCKDGL